MRRLIFLTYFAAQAFSNNATVIVKPTCVCPRGFNSSGLFKENGEWKFKDCVASACHCANGTSVNNQFLSALMCDLEQSNCGSCNPGYFLSNFKCNAYAGTCLNGNLVAQHQRTQNNHCGSCNANFKLVGKQCNPSATLSLISTGPIVLPRCAAGFGINATYACEACPAGRYQKQENESRFCIEQTQRQCVAGEELKHQNDATRDTVCTNCAPGRYSNSKTNFSCTDHTAECENTTITIRLATDTQDRSCAPIIDCNSGNETQLLAISVTDFVSGTSVWKCLGTFTGTITNPAILVANGTISDAATGTFTIETIAIAGGATVAVAGGSIAVVGAGVVAPAVAANAAVVNNVAARLARQFGAAGINAAKVNEVLAREGFNTAKDVTARSNALQSAIRELSPETTAMNAADQAADLLQVSDPNLIGNLQSEYANVLKSQKALAANLPSEAARQFAASQAASKAEQTILNKFGGISRGKQTEILKKIVKFQSAMVVPLSLQQRPRPRQYRYKNTAYHRVPNNKLQF